MGPAELDAVLEQLPRPRDGRLLVGLDSHDDAGVFRLSDEQVLIQTVDFFTPVVDDPYDFGRIAVANALSDIYAMGGQPLTALNIVGFPSDRIPMEVLSRILCGGAHVLGQAGVVLLGGHSVKDPELKYGIAVTGVARPAEVVTNAGARPGDRLILTKPLGTGVLTTVLKNGKLPEALREKVTQTMVQLNREAAQIMKKFQVHACTDVTGFGLIGHLLELVRASKVSARLWWNRVPFLEGARDFAIRGYLPGGLQANRRYAGGAVRLEARPPEEVETLLFDPQTSGGLLISVPPERASACIKALQDHYAHAAQIGEVQSPDDVPVVITRG